GWLRPPAGPEARLRWRHAAAVLVADDVLAAARPTSPVLRLANGVRRLVLSGAARLPEVPGTLTAGLLVGDDRGLPAGVAADFRAAGLSHLLAVSGANVALVLALAGPALRRLGLAGRFAGGVAVVGVFAAVARFEPSVLRAAVMAGIALVAAYAGRPAEGRRMLALAVAGLVLVDPFLVHSLGFQLSVAASAGILVLARPLAARLPGPGPVRAGLAVTAAAQLAVAPVALPAFGSLPLVAVPANLLAAPAAAALTVWGFGSGLAGGVLEPVIPGLPAVLAVPTGALAGYLVGVADLAARVPLSVGPPAVAGLVAVSLLAWTSWRRLRVRRLPAPASSSVPPRTDCPGPAPPGP
ncbi:MAG: ComEC/Rec2 family competence protein, partial [Acidimicrobiia bacterium]